jgi:hypothetical protein
MYGASAVGASSDFDPAAAIGPGREGYTAPNKSIFRRNFNVRLITIYSTRTHGNSDPTETDPDSTLGSIQSLGPVEERFTEIPSRPRRLDAILGLRPQHPQDSGSRTTTYPRSRVNDSVPSAAARRPPVTEIQPRRASASSSRQYSRTQPTSGSILTTAQPRPRSPRQRVDPGASSIPRSPPTSLGGRRVRFSDMPRPSSSTDRSLRQRVGTREGL